MNDLEQIQSAIVNAIQARDTLINVLEGLLVHEAQADHAAEKARAKSYLVYSTDGNKRTVAHLEALVMEECDIVNLEAKLAKAKLQAAKARLAAHESEISAFQSILSVRKSELSAVRFGQHSGA